MTDPNRLDPQYRMHNESSIDRAVRILLGMALLSLIIVGPKTLWGLVGLIPLVTGLVGFCPLYRILGISTCSIRGRRQAA